MTDWQAGDVAECVDDNNYADGGKMPGIRVGHEYTVMWAAVSEFSAFTPSGHEKRPVILGLLEAKNTLAWKVKDGRYAASRFVKKKPLIKETERETSREKQEVA